MSSSRTVLTVDRLSVGWQGTPAVRSVSLEVREGELLTLLGPNGAGKTTLLRAIAGFERPSEGVVRLGETDLGGVPPHRRGIGFLFQDAALFPHRTVYENVAYAPLLQRRPHAEIVEEVGRLVALLRLEPFLDRRPEQLSGGERQRVALARTLAARPRLVLLDEPFASVDVEVKAALRGEFRDALRRSNTAAIHVTHDREEALFLGDRVGLLWEGRLEALGDPNEVFGRPRSARTARFLGYNLLRSPAGTVAVLPDDLEVDANGTGEPFTVLASGTTGRRYLAILSDPRSERIELRSESPLTVGSTVRLRWRHEVALEPGEPDDPKSP